MKFFPKFVQWVMLLYAQAESTVRNHGWFTSSFLLSRGVRQGCPLSCHLFNFVSQITIYFLASNGIFLWWALVGDLASLYADDVAIILQDLSQLGTVIMLIQECGQDWFDSEFAEDICVFSFYKRTNHCE